MNDRARFEVDQLLSLFLGCTFLGTGVAKISSTDFIVATFGTSSWPAGLLMVLGLLEIAAAVLTIIPTTRLSGSVVIGLVMLGAMSYHLVRGEFVQLMLPLTLLVAAGSLALLERRGVDKPALQPVSNR